MSTDKLFKTRGLLLKNNFKEVPNKTQGLTNILTQAFGDYKYEDISIINGMSTYGELGSNGDLNFLGVREYNRLSLIEIEDLGKPAINEVFQKANPFQTIKNQLDKISIQLGEAFETGGGDGLLAQYYNWTDVYGDAPDIRSEGGGSFVADQTNYFTPNTAVAPSDSEAFYEFDENDLSGKRILAEEITFKGGIFNYSNRAGFHPTIVNTSSNAGIAKFSGFFNPGFFTFGDGGGTRVGGDNTTDRILITTNSGRYDNSQFARVARTSTPIVMKFWDVDQVTGERLTSDDNPLFVARYAPSLNSDRPKFDDDSDGDGLTDGDNPPAYYFVKANSGGINDQFQSPNDIHGNNAITNMIYQNDGAYVVAPIQDGRMTRPETERNKYLNPFKPDTFYSMEMYFILSPRVADSVKDRTVYLEGYDRYNSRVQTLHAHHFWSENPLSNKFKKGKLSEKIKFGIPRTGTNLSGNSTRIGTIANEAAKDNTPSYLSHIHSVGNDNEAGAGIARKNNYKRLFSDQRIFISYKAPHSWNEIFRGDFIAPNLGPQAGGGISDEFHKYHYVVYGLPKTTPKGIKAASRQVGDKELPRVGNLLIDANSPKPRNVKGGDSGSVFDSFTYIDRFSDSDPRFYTYLSKPVTGIHRKCIGSEAGTKVQIIDHHGLKGYGCGKIIHLPDGRNKLEVPGIHDYNCPRTFYDGPPLGLRDIIIFEDYNDTPFIQVSDTSPNGTYVVMRSSQQQSKPTVDGKEPGFNQAQLETKNLANAYSDTNEFDFHKNLGKNFFVYHHRGLVDKSLDSYCVFSDVATDGEVIEAKAILDADVGASKIEVDRNDISTYSGSRKAVPDSPRDSFGNRIQFGVWGKFIDVNGTLVPNGTVINEYYNYKVFPRQVFTTTMAGSGSLKWELRQTGYNCPRPLEGEATNLYGSPHPGDYYFQAAGESNKNLRLMWHRGSNKDKFYGGGNWRIFDGVFRTGEGAALSGNALASWSSTSRQVLPTGAPASISADTSVIVGPSSNYTLYTNSALDSQTNIGGHDSPNVPVGLGLFEPDAPYEVQPLISVVKEGFGVTICNDTTKASLKYQCFKPTNTAPPFLATTTGLRTIPQGLTTANVDNVNSVKVSYASPGAGSNVTDAAAGQIGIALNGDKNGDFRNAPVTKIVCSSFFVSGNYGNNSPGINQVPGAGFVNTTVSQHEAGTGNYFQPGGVIQNDTDDVYDRLIEFENIDQFGQVQRFQLIGTTRSDPTAL